ncbi:MAG: nucleotidyltransferase domain-containing protein [Burkholderiaceae bacterium]
MADALFSRTQQRVLGILFGQPGRSFYTAEIIGLAAAGSGSVQRELARLAGVGLIVASRIGNQKHYQANRHSPLFEELTSIATKTFAVAEPIRAALKPLWKKLDAAFVYGSVAKKSDTSGSDIDLFLVSHELRYGDVLRALAMVNIGREVSPTLFSRAELEKRLKEDDGFVTSVLAQPKIWIKGSIDDLTSRSAGRTR